MDGGAWRWQAVAPGGSAARLSSYLPVNMRMSDPRLAELSGRLPDLVLKTDAADLEYYGRDWTRRWTPAPLAIALPSRIEEVQGIVRWANEYGIALVPSGGRTGLSGGAVAANGELVVSTERMNRVLGYSPADRAGTACSTSTRSTAR